MGFQSLFWWKYCPGETPRRKADASVRCFNPCSGGSIALGLMSAQPERRTGASFNPCSGGSIALGALVDSILTGVPGFNPCSGGSIALGIPGRVRVCRCGVVSILVLVEVLPWAFAHVGGKIHMETSFNPCSGGSIALGWALPSQVCLASMKFQSLFWWKYCPGMGFTITSMSCVYEVSILVLVEVLPWEADPLRLREGNRSFNPCSGGSIALGSSQQPLR